MLKTAAPPTVKHTLEEVKGLGPAEKLPAIQHKNTDRSTTSLQSTIAQLPMPPGYKGVTKSNDDRSRTDLLRLNIDSEQEPNPSVSDSEDEDDTAPKALNISERRKVQNSKFSAWCVFSLAVTEFNVKAHVTTQVIKAHS